MSKKADAKFDHERRVGTAAFAVMFGLLTVLLTLMAVDTWHMLDTLPQRLAMALLPLAGLAATIFVMLFPA